MSVVRLNDTSSHGGHVTTATSGFKVGGIPVAVNHDLHSCPVPGHNVTPITATSTKSFSAGKNILRAGDIAGCGAIIISSAPTVIIGG